MENDPRLTPPPKHMEFSICLTVFIFESFPKKDMNAEISQNVDVFDLVKTGNGFQYATKSQNNLDDC